MDSTPAYFFIIPTQIHTLYYSVSSSNQFTNGSIPNTLEVSLISIFQCYCITMVLKLRAIPISIPNSSLFIIYFVCTYMFIIIIYQFPFEDFGTLNVLLVIIRSINLNSMRFHILIRVLIIDLQTMICKSLRIINHKRIE